MEVQIEETRNKVAIASIEDNISFYLESAWII